MSGTSIKRKQQTFAKTTVFTYVHTRQCTHAPILQLFDCAHLAVYHFARLEDTRQNFIGLLDMMS